MGVWVAVDPAGFQDIVAAKPVLSAGAYLLLAVGIALSLLGFLGCCGALRRSRPLLLVVSEGRRMGRQAGDAGSRAGRGLRAAGARGMWGARGRRVLGDAGRPRRNQKPGVPRPGPVSPQRTSQSSESLNLEPRGFYKATEWGHSSLKPLPCPTRHFRAFPLNGEVQNPFLSTDTPISLAPPDPGSWCLFLSLLLAATVLGDVASVPRSCALVPCVPLVSGAQGTGRAGCRGGEE